MTSFSRSQPDALFLIVTYCLPVTPPQLTVNGPTEASLFTVWPPQSTADELDVSPSGSVLAKTWNVPSMLGFLGKVVKTTSEMGVPAGISMVSHGESSLPVTAPVPMLESIAFAATKLPLKVELWLADTGVT